MNFINVFVSTISPCVPALSTCISVAVPYIFCWVLSHHPPASCVFIVFTMLIHFVHLNIHFPQIFCPDPDAALLLNKPKSRHLMRKY